MLDPLSLHIPTSDTRPAPQVHPTRKLLQPSPDHPDDYILELDYSTISKFLECPRAMENYSLNSREADRNRSATDFGKLFHTLEELRLQAGGFSDALRVRQHELIQQHFVSHPTPPGDHRTAQRMVQIIKVYEERYAADGWPQALLEHEGGKMVERAFKVGLCSVEVNALLPYPASQLIALGEISSDVNFRVRNIHVFYTGRIDAVLRDSGHLWVVDHKTSSMGGREFEDAFRLSLQTRGYVWAAQKLLNMPLAGLIMNAVVVKKPTLKVENNTELNRHPYFYTPDSLVEFEDNMRAHVSDFISMLCRGYFPQTARSFKSPCAMCDYTENCALPRHQRNTDLASPLYRDVTWNPVHE
jgi:PD-(D/E)XK nuclease superfamily